MPQGRKKVPFSGKAKKEQLKAKKHLKAAQGHRPLLLQNSDDEEDFRKCRSINEQPRRRRAALPPPPPSPLGSNTNRYALKFYAETSEELRLRKEKAKEQIVPVPEEQLEIDADAYFPEGIGFPKRPPWSYEMSREELETRENRYFTEYINGLEKRFGWNELGYFELNLETWRQLWRVLEMSDIILIIVDIRYAALMFPPALYEHVTNQLSKDMVLVLNKIDLAPAPLVAAWKNYFKDKYPNLHIVLFTTVPGYNLRGNTNEKSGLKIRRRKARLRMAAEGAQLLFDACHKIVGEDKVALGSWQKKIKDEMALDYEDAAAGGLEVGETQQLNKVDTGYFEHEKYGGGVLTIGCVGQPNVGKSSVLNAVMGRKVVSVSRTPGHTKHFQTIYLTETVRLCDCPGLVFPSQVPKALQVLMGSFPIAQLRDPYTTVRFLAERLDLVRLLKIAHPSEDDDDDSWSVMDVCDGWAKKRGFLTAKAARFDTYRAANNILRMSLDGKICLCLYPPHYVARKAEWSSHPDVKTVRWIQALTEEEEGSVTELTSNVDASEDDSDDESEEKWPTSRDSKRETEDHASATQTNKFALLPNE